MEKCKRSRQFLLHVPYDLIEPCGVLVDGFDAAAFP
jgi:hypothetical protein